jgi:hypothetical protein
MKSSLTIEDIDRLVENRHLADFFEEVIAEYKKLLKRGKVNENSSDK